MNLLILYLRKAKPFFSFLFVVLLLSCKSQNQTIKNTSPKNGIKGKIIFREGDFYPSGEIKGSGRVYAVKREIFIHQLTTLKEADLAEGNFIKNIYSTPVDTIVSNDQGEFFAPLEPGEYSLFVNENHRLYSKITETGRFLPVVVKKDSVEEITIEIDYKANY